MGSKPGALTVEVGWQAQTLKRSNGSEDKPPSVTGHHKPYKGQTCWWQALKAKRRYWVANLSVQEQALGPERGKPVIGSKPSVALKGDLGRRAQLRRQGKTGKPMFRKKKLAKP